MNGPDLHDAIAAIHLMEKIRRFHAHPVSSFAALGRTQQAHRPGLTRNTSHSAMDWALDVERTIQQQLADDDQEILWLMLVRGTTRDELAYARGVTPQRVSQLLSRAAGRATVALMAAELIRSTTRTYNDHIAQPVRQRRRCRGPRLHRRPTIHAPRIPGAVSTPIGPEIPRRQRSAPRIHATADPRRYTTRPA